MEQVRGVRPSSEGPTLALQGVWAATSPLLPPLEQRETAPIAAEAQLQAVPSPVMRQTGHKPGHSPETRERPMDAREIAKAFPNIPAAVIDAACEIGNHEIGSEEEQDAAEVLFCAISDAIEAAATRHCMSLDMSPHPDDSTSWRYSVTMNGREVGDLSKSYPSEAKALAEGKKAARRWAAEWCRINGL